MIIIKKGELKIELPRTSFAQVQDTSDGFYFQTSDGTEIRLNCEMTPQLKAVASMITKSTSENVLVDLNNMKTPISFE